MSNHAFNINTNGAAQNTFDAIVIGSGISGGWAAKELCGEGDEKGEFMIIFFITPNSSSGKIT